MQIMVSPNVLHELSGLSSASAFGSFVFLIIIDVGLLAILKFAYNVPIDLRTLVFDIILYSILVTLSRVNRVIHRLSTYTFFFHHIILVLVIILATSGIGSLYLMNDDSSYHRYALEAASNLPLLRANVFEWTRLYEGAYYYRFLEILYRFFGMSTLVGRFFNIFAINLACIILSRTFYSSFEFRTKTTFLLFFFPDWLFFAVFEFKEALFVLLCSLIVVLGKAAVDSGKKAKRFLLLVAALSIAIYSNRFRVMVPYIFFFFSSIPFLLGHRLPSKVVKLRPLYVLTSLILVSIAVLAFATFLGSNSILSFSGRMSSYLSYTYEMQMESSGFLRLFFIGSIVDSIKIPLSIVFVPFTPVDFFSSKANTVLFGLFRFWSLAIIAFFFLCLFSRNSKTTIYYLSSIYIATFSVLTLLTISNIGIARHFLFIAPFLVLSMDKYAKWINLKRIIITGLTIYCLYYIMILVKSF